MNEEHDKSESVSMNTFSSFWPLGAAIVAIALGWGEMRSQMKSEEQVRKDAISQVAVELSRIVGSFEQLEERSRTLEDKSARIEERFIMIVNSLAELKAQIAVMNGKVIKP